MWSGWRYRTIIHRIIVFVEQTSKNAHTRFFFFQETTEQIVREYKETKQNPVYQQMKERFDYLHNKLSHIKRLILEYDTENAGRMSISNIDNDIMSANFMNNGSNNIRGIDNRHYWHKLKRPPLIPSLFLGTVNIAVESAFPRQILRLIFHGLHGSCVLSPKSQMTLNGSRLQDFVYDIYHKASCNIDKYISYARYSSCESSQRLRRKSRSSRRFPRRRRPRRLLSSR